MPLIDAIVNPGRLFKHIKEKDDWWIPFLVVVVIAIIASLVNFPIFARFMSERMQEFGKTVDRELISRLRWINLISIFIASFFFLMLTSFVFWAISLGFKARWSFMKSLDLVAYASLVQSIQAILNIIWIYIRGPSNIMSFRDMSLKTGLDLFFNPTNRRLLSIVSHVNVFTIWFYTLLAFGVAEIAGLDRKKSAIVSVITFIVMLGIRYLLAARGGGRWG
ncbi:MAG TPA: YIP1 family protein [candidate division WOR-3 bacterium]|uniref:YIP1 family protein n=1 Tax=candidate division WOR-3 bacterium TaxID=2052148 RepID=A0A7C0V9P8_UNCW3|nr:YIP1 family protein [candidate division WOR-3 bacterium]